MLIGNGVKVQNNVSIYDGVCLEDDVFCGPSMVFTNVHNPRATINRKNEFRPTVIHKGTLGANCTIVCGVVVGKFAFMGAGAVVTKDAAICAYGGCSGRQIGWVDEGGVRTDQPPKDCDSQILIR